jgi:hypothetical protein
MGLAIPGASEIKTPAKLEPAHVAIVREAGNLAGLGRRDISVRQPKIGMVEAVESVGSQRKSNSFRDAEGLRECDVLVDEMRSVERIYRIISKGIRSW